MTANAIACTLGNESLLQGGKFSIGVREVANSAALNYNCMLGLSNSVAGTRRVLGGNNIGVLGVARRHWDFGRRLGILKYSF